MVSSTFSVFSLASVEEEAEQPESFEVTDIGVDFPDGGST